MKYFIFLIPVIISLSCETEIDIVHESNSVPIIYCILNQDDTIQSLKLSRSYLSGNAQNPPLSQDSLLIKGEVNLTIETVENSQVTAVDKLKPYLVEKDSGFFPNDSQLIYKGFFKIKENTSYRLIVEIKEWDYLAYSSFLSLGDFKLIDPSYPEAREIHMLDDHNPVIHWTKSQNASVYQVGCRIHYQEIRSDRRENRSMVILFTTVFYRDDPGGFYTYLVNSNQFYKRLSDSMPADPDLLRQLTDVDVFVLAGSESLGFYLSAQLMQDPFQFYDYKNLINGQGVFGSCKTKEMKGFEFDDQSLDSLAYGSLTNQLNFLDSNGHRKN